jgi:carbon-monoxide dehydrogenase large subunit
VLEAAEADLELRDGCVQVAGVPGLSVPFSEIATALRGVPGYSIPATIEPGLEAEVNFRIDALAYANACHAVEVEVDIDTGAVKILRYVALQDCGTLVNPLIVKGQVQGGIIHGIGNALYEWMGYDAEAQPVTVTFADYLLPAACEMPNIELLFKQSPSPLNPLGAKGVGEVGTIAVAPALASAIEDAVGVRITAVPILPAVICLDTHRANLR